MICQLKNLHYLCNRFSSPDGGIGRRAGLKHQWGNTRAGSTPALGTSLKAQGAETEKVSAPCYFSVCADCQENNNSAAR